MDGKEGLLRRSDVQNPTAKDILIAYIAPGILLVAGIYHHVIALLEIVFIKRQPSLLLNFPAVRDLAFSLFWLANGEALSADMPLELTPLLSSLRGTVLDIGPGSGEQLHRYSPAAVNKIYGAEPATKLHLKLRSKATEAGFGDKYCILGCGAEPGSLVPALAKEDFFKGSNDDGLFDDIVSIRVLCGVPDEKETADGLYKLLKPGGRLIVMEHVVAKGSPVARILQGLYMWVGGWRFWMGGCCLDRDTERVLRGAGAWSDVQLKTLNGWSTVPQIVGYLVKN